MPELEVARDLLILAEEDVKALRVMRGSSEFSDRIFGFHAQQAVEKALKAWLALLDVDYPYEHSLQTLLSMLRGAGAECERFGDLAALTPYAVQFRYWAGYSGGEVDRGVLLALVAELVGHVRGLLAEAEETSADR